MFTNPHSQLARDMVRTQLQSRGVTDSCVLNAMINVPRHLFMDLPVGDQAKAYADQPNPIGQGQTISQPYIVAVMTQWLDVQPGHQVLEIGLGSGYQCAVLLELGATVWSIERNEILASTTRQRLASLLADTPQASELLHTTIADGTFGWPQSLGMGPSFDRIIVTAGAPHLPDAYVDQLAPNGKIVIPIGSRTSQQLTLYEHHDGKLVRKNILACRFVPLVGADGWPE